MKPNIVLLFTDDQRFDTIGALGNPQIRTPHMDALVRRGTAFTHACIPGGTSGAVCMPSRAMLHTGRTLFHLEGSGGTIPKEHTMLGEALRGEGYRTFGSGKWHNWTDSYHRSFTDGAEIFFGGMADHWNVPAFDYDPSGRYDQQCPYIEHPLSSREVKHRHCDHIHVGRHSTDLVSAAGIDFLEQYTAPDPYLLYLSFLAPHDPRSMPREFLDLYDPETIELPENFMGAHPFDNGELQVRDEKLAAFPRTREEVRQHLAEYYAMITHIDTRIGEVVEAVRKRGELDNTIFVLCGDNGLALGQHGLMGKQSLYDHSVRVPLIFAGPGIPEGHATDALGYLLDIFPTLCELTEIPVPESVDGISLVDAMKGDGAGRKHLYLAYRDLHRGVRTDRYKLIEYVVEGCHVMTQLFDLKQDPWEMKNLADCSEHAEILRDLRTSLIDLRDEWGDRETPWGETFWKDCDLNRA